MSLKKKQKSKTKQDKQFVSLIDKNLLFVEYSLTNISALPSVTRLFLLQGQQEPMRGAKLHIFTPN